MRLVSRLIETEQITTADRRRMFALMSAHYLNVQRSTFELDLDEKRWVIEVRDPRSGELCGFSTQMLLDAQVAGRPGRVLFSGDTIIDRQRWGDYALPHVWGQFVLTLLEELPCTELYWFLLSKGYRTYRYLPVFFHEFYPRYDRPTPAWANQAIHTLASGRYLQSYDPACGVVRASTDQYRLREELAPVTAEKLRDPHISFFVQHNPGHLHGDELCCLAPLSRQNFTAAASRVIGEPARVELSCRG